MHRRKSNARPRNERNFAGWTGVHSNRSTEVGTPPIETIRSAVKRREKEASNAPNSTPIGWIVTAQYPFEVARTFANSHEDRADCDRQRRLKTPSTQEANKIQFCTLEDAPKLANAG